MKKRLLYSTALFFVFVLVGIAGCGGQSFNYHSDNEIPEGPGIFSKEEGAFTVYSSDSGQGEGNIKTKEAAVTDTEAAQPASKAESEKAEFEAFQQWKKEQAEFNEFKAWKQSQDGAEEYAEFLEWKRWQEYRRWQDKNKTHQ
jgi:hypothetical protein